MLPSGFFGGKSIREMQGFLDAERATNICIALCIKGFLRSRWSVEMTGIRGGFVRAIVVLIRWVDWDLKADGAHKFEGVAGLYDAWF